MVVHHAPRRHGDALPSAEGHATHATVDSHLFITAAAGLLCLGRGGGGGGGGALLSV